MGCMDSGQDAKRKERYFVISTERRRMPKPTTARTQKTTFVISTVGRNLPTLLTVPMRSLPMVEMTKGEMVEMTKGEKVEMTKVRKGRKVGMQGKGYPG
jgi:hypothetical protein